MDPRKRVSTMLGQAGGETLHWTVVLDRALTQRLIDPFTTSDVRGVVVKSLAALAKEGRVVKQGAGLYQAVPTEASRRRPRRVAVAVADAAGSPRRTRPG